MVKKLSIEHFSTASLFIFTLYETARLKLKFLKKNDLKTKYNYLFSINM